MVVLLRCTEKLTNLEARTVSDTFFFDTTLEIDFYLQLWSCRIVYEILCIHGRRAGHDSSEFYELSPQARSGVIQFSAHSGDRAQRAA